jgi:hypothetical protein
MRKRRYSSGQVERVLNELEVPEAYREPLPPSRGKREHVNVGGIYSEELSAEICERIAGGEQLVSILEDSHMPSIGTITRWKHAHPEFNQAYAAARARSIIDFGPLGGKPFVPFSKELAAEVCERIENGESITELCADLEMPSWRTICRWRRENPEFSSAYAQAREASAEACEHNAIREAEMAKSRETFAAAKVRSDIWKWTAAVRNPATHGNKLDAKVSIEIGLSDRLNAALARQIAGSVIDLKPDEAIYIGSDGPETAGS